MSKYRKYRKHVLNIGNIGNIGVTGRPVILPPNLDWMSRGVYNIVMLLTNAIKPMARLVHVVTRGSYEEEMVSFCSSSKQNKPPYIASA